MSQPDQPAAAPSSQTTSVPVPTAAAPKSSLPAYGFWLAMAALGFIALIPRAPPGPFTPAPFGFAKRVLRKCGVSVS